MQMAALVGGADHKHAHVVGLGQLDGRPVVLTDEIPVEIDVVKGVAGDRLADQGQESMGGEAHMADAALGLPAPQHLTATAGPQALLEMLWLIEAVERHQIHPLQPQALKAGSQLGLKGLRLRVGRHLGLQDAQGIGHLVEQPAQLPLRGAVVTGRLDVVEARRHSLLQESPQIGLTRLGDLIGRQVVPALLKTHAAQGEHWHGELSAAEPPGGEHQDDSLRGRVRLGRAGEGTPRGRIS